MEKIVAAASSLPSIKTLPFPNLSLQPLTNIHQTTLRIYERLLEIKYKTVVVVYTNNNNFLATLSRYNREAIVPFAHTVKLHVYYYTTIFQGYINVLISRILHVLNTVLHYLYYDLHLDVKRLILWSGIGTTACENGRMECNAILQYFEFGRVHWVGILVTALVLRNVEHVVMLTVLKPRSGGRKGVDVMGRKVQGRKRSSMFPTLFF